MSGQNLSQRRLVNPILTNVAQGYRNPALVGYELFPPVPVRVAGGKVIEFGKEAMKLYDLRRAPGGNTTRIDIGYEGKDFALTQRALEAKVPIEDVREAKEVPGIDLGKHATETAMDVLLLDLEVEQAGLALNAANYDNNHKVALSGTSKWSSDDANPAKQIDDYKEAIRLSTGGDPNVLLLSGAAFKAIRNNPHVIERFKYTSKDSVDPEMLAALLGLEKVVVGKAVYASQNGAFSDVWGNNAVLARVPQKDFSRYVPSYGYTYVMEGHPFVKQPYYEENVESWIYGGKFERRAVLTGITSGFLIQSPS